MPRESWNKAYLMLGVVKYCNKVFRIEQKKNSKTESIFE